MFLKNEACTSCAIYCNCGCNNGVTLKIEKDEFFDDCIDYNLSLVSDNYYLSQHTNWSRFKEKCKRIWQIIRNKEYQFFDICLNEEDLSSFYKFISKFIPENTKNN